MPTMGEVLREARYRQTVSLEQAEAYTKVRKKYLIALEEDDYAELPSPVYARGFLQIYAEFLGIDPIAADKMFQPPQGRVPELGIRPAASGIPASGGLSMRGLVTVLLSALGIGAIFLLYWQYSKNIAPMPKAERRTVTRPRIERPPLAGMPLAAGRIPNSGTRP